jgi:hypothetical protein
MTDLDDHRRITSVAIYAGSKWGKNPAYRHAAERMGTLLGQNGYDMIYGGGDFGLMGVVAKAALAAGSKVRGLIVRAWANVSGSAAIQGVDEAIVEDKYERMAIMRNETQASILLPGGIGSWEELVTILSHQDEQRYVAPDALPRPIIVLNTNGIYNHLKGLIDETYDEGFVYEPSRNLVRFADTPEEVIEILSEYQIPAPKPAGNQSAPQPRI